MHKGSRSGRRLWAGLAALCAAPLAFALPTGEQVAAGNVSFRRSGGLLDIRQTSAAAVVNWRDFSIASGERVQVAQPGAQAAMLARVGGAGASSINGSLLANGRLYLINPNGVIVGPQGVINTAAFMASTLDVADKDFLSGKAMTFAGASQAGIVNFGTIRAGSGDVTLVAHSVRNEGSIQAPNGAANLFAAHELFLASPDAPAVLVSVGKGGEPAGTGVANSGTVQAVQARLQAADGNLYALAINQSGVIRASGVSVRNGRIVLTADGGDVAVSGSQSARNADGSGGEILIGGDFRGQGDLPRADRTRVDAAAVIDASGSGVGGKVAVWADQRTDFAGTVTAGTASAKGQGGNVEISGKHRLFLADTAKVDANGTGGQGGSILLDPDQITVANGGADTNLSGSVVTMSPTTLQGLLAGGNVTLDTSTYDYQAGNGNIAIDSDIVWNNTNTLTLRSGNGIALNANITAASGSLAMYAGKGGFWLQDGSPISVDTAIRLAAGKTVQVDTLSVGLNADAAPLGYTASPFQSASLIADGDIVANTLTLDLSNGSVGVIAIGNNALGRIQTSGIGDLGLLNIRDTTGDLNLKLTADSTGYIELSTPGRLTLESGSSLAATSPTDVILASTGGNFVNQAGSGVFGNNVRYLIYTGTVAGTSKGGLTGTDDYSRTYTGNPPSDYSSDTTSRFLFAQAAGTPDLTYRADSLSKLYGDANPALTYTVTGLLAGDVLSNVVTGSPSLSTTATLSSGVGNYVINISQGTLASSAYSFSFQPGTLTVNPAPLTIDIGNASRYYGEVNPTFTRTVTGLKAGDTAAGILAGWAVATSATRASDVGAYPIQASWLGTGSTNYTYTINAGTLTINPAPVTVSLAPTARTYGDANPDFRTLATLSGAYNGDTVATAFPSSSFTTAATQASSVGIYSVSAGGFSNPNYLVTVGGIGALTVNKASLVVNANDASRLYGDANPAFSVASVSGLRNGDTLASLGGLTLTSAATGTTPVGSYPIVPGGSAANYDFVAGTGTLTINKAPLVVRLNAATRYYGDPDPAFSATYEGLKNGETTVPELHPVSNTNVYTPVGSYLISAGGTTTFQNYLPTFYAAPLTIAPRPLTVAASDAERTYGQSNPTLGVTVTGATSWDQAQAARYWIAGTTAGDHSDVGSYSISPSANPYGDRFDNLANYAVTLRPGTLNVTRAPLRIVPTPVSILWGDGQPPLTYTVSGGLMPWDAGMDTSGAVLTSAAATLAAPPGSYPITLSQADIGGNYAAVINGSPQVTVLKRPVTITGSYSVDSNDLNKVFPGQIEPMLVTRYDNGRAITYTTTTPLAEGPQFKVSAGTDGTRGDGLLTYVTAAYVEPAAGYTLADVLRYYEPVSKPGVATASVGSLTHITTQVTVEQKTISLSQDNKLSLTWQSGQPPTMERLISSALPGGDALQSLYAQYRNSEAFGYLDQDSKALLLDAQANASSNKAYRDWIDGNLAWIAKVKAEKPANWESMVASAEADIAKWRAEIAKHPGLDELRQRAMDGDPAAAKAIMPLLATGMLQAVADGTLPSEAQAQLLAAINDQRSKITASADRKYQEFLKKQEMESSTLGSLFSKTKVPDLVGSAFIDVAAEQTANDMKTSVAGSIGAGAGVIAGMTAGMIAMPISGTASSVFAAAAGEVVKNFAIAGGSAGAAAAPAIGAAFAIAVGVAEGVQVVESEKNLQRYQDFKAANGQLTSLTGLNVKNKDNLAQAMLAIQGMLMKGLGNTEGQVP